MSKQPEREIDDRLADWVDGRLGERERERFVAELRVNAQLRQDLAEYERTVAVVRAALRAPTHTPGLVDRMMTAVTAEATGTRRSGSAPRRHPVYWSLAAAAALLVLAVAIDRWPTAAPTTDSGIIDRVASVDLDRADAPDESLLRKADKEKAVGADVDAAGKPALERLAKAGEAPAAPAAPAPGAPDAGAGGGAVAPGAAARSGSPPERGAVAEPAPQPDPAAEAKKQAPTVVTGAVVAETAEGTTRLQQEIADPSGDESVRAKAEQANPVLTQGLGDAKGEADQAEGRRLTVGAPGAKTAQPLPMVTLPMVSLTRYRSAPAPTTGGPPAAANPNATATQSDLYSATRYLELPAEFEGFLASQVAQPSGYFKKLGETDAERRATSSGARYGTLSIAPLVDDTGEAEREQAQNKDVERRAARARTEAKSEEKPELKPGAAPVADPKAPVESYWLVDGSKAEVSELLRGLADYAKRSGLELANGEFTADAGSARGRSSATRGAPSASSRDAAPSPPKQPAPADKEAARGEQEPMRIVLRFRVLPPK